MLSFCRSFIVYFEFHKKIWFWILLKSICVLYSYCFRLNKLKPIAIYHNGYVRFVTPDFLHQVCHVLQNSVDIWTNMTFERVYLCVLLLAALVQIGLSANSSNDLCPTEHFLCISITKSYTYNLKIKKKFIII